jgi:DNA-binding response OmpR family regulator
MTTPHILIVDDSTLVTDALRLFFESSGYRVSIANDVTTAVTTAMQRSADDPLDALLLDLTLPDGDGLSILTHMREHNAAMPRITIAVTGHDNAVTKDRCLAAGCQAVLVKPIRPRALLAAVLSPGTVPQ